MAGVVTAAAFIRPIVPWHHDEVRTLTDARTAESPNMLNGKSPTVTLQFPFAKFYRQ